MKVKMCGFTIPEEAYLAATLGADYIGLIFAPISPRKVNLVEAKKIMEAIQGTKAKAVAVFVDETAQGMSAICKELGIEFVQLHGDGAKKEVKLLPKHLKKIYVVHESIEKEDLSSLDPEKDFLLFHGIPLKETPFRSFIAGGLECKSSYSKNAFGVDVARGIEKAPGKKDVQKMKEFLRAVKKEGYFGSFGGAFIPEILVSAVEDLKESFQKLKNDPVFLEKFFSLLKNYAGRPTPLTEVPRFSEKIDGPRIFLKREDLLHTGAHKLNNAIGQCLLAKEMGKTRIIAETGAGQHGVATATACARLGLQCVVYMGKKDMERQMPNVLRMRLLGAEVVPIETGSQTLKDAVNEALRDWSSSYPTTHYCLGSALGPHPFPEMVAFFQKIIGEEVKEQFTSRFNKNPDLIVACVGGGSNAIGIFSAFLKDKEVELVGVEAGGKNGLHAARFQGGTPGVLHGAFTYLLQDKEGQVAETHSISAGLDYPAVGPQHAELFLEKRVNYTVAVDDEVIEAFHLLAKTEGIIPALESSHALAYVVRIAKTLSKDKMVVINLSGRGDKDLGKNISN